VPLGELLTDLLLQFQIDAGPFDCTLACCGFPRNLCRFFLDFHLMLRLKQRTIAVDVNTIYL